MPPLWSDPPIVYLVRQQKVLDDYPMPQVLRWFLRWVYNHYGFAGNGCKCGCYCSFEDRGVFVDEADARWAANCHGGSYKQVPLDAALPEETCRFGIHDFPQSEASPMYRNRQLPYCTVPSRQIEWLQDLLNQERS